MIYWLQIEASQAIKFQRDWSNLKKKSCEINLAQHHYYYFLSFYKKPLNQGLYRQAMHANNLGIYIFFVILVLDYTVMGWNPHSILKTHSLSTLLWDFYGSDYLKFGSSSLADFRSSRCSLSSWVVCSARSFFASFYSFCLCFKNLEYHSNPYV